ncbi:response regulator [Marinoscillum sp.]|uniref:response regulator n=1 Tax=Marinoscillum sp. TaxID=2024838 RepID=UPI003BA91BB1
MKLLLAEPNKLMQKVLTERLRQEDVELTVVDNGLEALTLIQNKSVDFVVSEELLPYKNGFELIRHSVENNIPIIIISDADLENKILEAFELGAIDFIDKPFSPHELVVRVKNASKKIVQS